MKFTLPDQVLGPPSWDQVRGIYKKLSEEFHILTDSYKLNIDEKTKVDLDHLIVAIDEVDNCVDDIPDKETRDSITQSLVEYLKNDIQRWNHPNATDSLSEKIENLKIIVHQGSILEEFLKAVEGIFHFTEIKRHTVDKSELINYVIEEGKSTAALPLSILKIEPNSPFGIFFTRLCMLMGVADLIIDARSDYHKGFIKIKPSIVLYLKLNTIMIKEGIMLLWDFPKKIKFLGYCIRFSFALFKE